jgi:hypothetical protein
MIVDVPQRASRSGRSPIYSQPKGETHAFSPVAVQSLWIVMGLVVAFGIPFVFADLAEVQRDVYYGIYAGSVAAFLALWVRLTRQSARAMSTRHLRALVVLTVVCGGLLVLIVVRDPAAGHPGGWTFAGEILWRGVVYGAVDGLLLSAFPILATFAAFSATPLRERSRKAVAGIGALALAVSLAFTAVYHLGYPDFRSSKVKKPLSGDLIWSAPTLATLNPVGAPLAHIALHVAAVTHSYNTGTFLPPHRK